MLQVARDRRLIERLSGRAKRLAVGAACQVLSIFLVTGLAIMRAIFRAGLGPKRPPLMAPRKTPMNPKSAGDALHYFLTLANEAGAKVFLISGTLLGFYRSGGLLKHDQDIDLGVMWNDPRLPRLLSVLNSAERLRLHRFIRLGPVTAMMNPAIPALYKQAVTVKYEYSAEGGSAPVRIDVFIHFPSNGEIVHGSRRTLWGNTPFSLGTLRSGEVELPTPANCAAYLAENYGDFLTEQPIFESSVDCPNSRNCLSLTAVSFLLRKYWQFRARGDRRRTELIVRRIQSFRESTRQPISTLDLN